MPIVPVRWIKTRGRLCAMSHLSLVDVRDGKHAIRWPLLLVRFAVYLVLFGGIVFLVTWASDRLFHKDDLGNVARLVTIPSFLAVLFVFHDVRRDLREAGPKS